MIETTNPKSAPKFAVSHRYHHGACQKRGPHEWSRRPEAAHGPLVVADADDALDAHVLLVVPAGEAAGVVLGEGSAVVVHRLAAVHRGDAAVCELDVRFDPRVLGERLRGSAICSGSVSSASLPS